MKWLLLPAASSRTPLASAARESDNAIGVEVSIPIARARCCVTINLGISELHNIENSRSLWSSSPSTGKSDQVFAGRVDTNRPSRLQFAQGTADIEMLSAAKEGGYGWHWRGVHSLDLLFPGAFVEHRKSQIIPLEIRWIFRIEWPIVALILR